MSGKYSTTPGRLLSAWKRTSILALSAGILVGCNGLLWPNSAADTADTPSPITASPIALPPQWQGTATPSSDTPKSDASKTEFGIREEANAAAPATWWEGFEDAALSALITQSLAQNHDLAAARTRIERARAARTIARAALFPDITFGTSAKRSDQPFTDFEKSPSHLFDAKFDASWEIDLFGGNRKRQDAATAELRASEASARDVQVQLAAEVARNYVDYRRWQQELAITERTVASEEALLQLIRARREAGLISELEVAQAETQLRSTQSTISDILSARDTALFRLHTLAGVTPGSLTPQLEMLQPIPTIRAAIVLGAPASTLAERPDVQRAAASLKAATALSEAALTEFYPKLSLAALVGAQSGTNVSSDPIWSVGGKLVAPLFNMGRVQANADAAKADEKIAWHTYAQQMLQALEDVEASLVRYQYSVRAQQHRSEAVTAARTAVEIARERYSKGITGFLDVLVAQEALFTAERAAVRADADAATATIALYKALGGTPAAQQNAADTPHKSNANTVPRDTAAPEKTTAPATQTPTTQAPTQNDAVTETVPDAKESLPTP